MRSQQKSFVATHKKAFAAGAGLFVVAAACTVGGITLANQASESTTLTPVALPSLSSSSAVSLQTVLDERGIVLAEDDQYELTAQQGGGIKGTITHANGSKTEILIASDGSASIHTIPAPSSEQEQKTETVYSSSQAASSRSEANSPSKPVISSESSVSSFFKDEDEYDPNAPLDADYIVEHVTYQTSHFMTYAPDEWKKAFEAGVLTREQYDTLRQTHGEMQCHKEDWALEDITVEFPINGYADIFRGFSNKGYTQFDFIYEPFQQQGKPFIRFLFYYQ
ncbi:MAG: hypothetical protein ACOX6U_05515 [Oscillospiraceae bacterium]|jgi:hypothetical protein